MALNVIIIAAIALVVMVIVLFIFGSKSSDISKTTEDCGAKFGECLLKEDCIGRPIISNTDCEKNDEVCCIKLS